MENIIELDKYIFYLASNGMLKLSQIKWPVSNHAYFDYQAEIHINEFKVIGRGTSTCENTAIRIAFAEAYERLIVKENRLLSTNGCAVHLDVEKAKANALAELKERDCFLFHHHFGFNKNFKTVETPDNLLRLVIDVSVNVETLQYKTIEDFFSITSIEFQEGIVLGISLNTTPSISLEKSFIEAYRQYIYFNAFSTNNKYNYKNFGNLKNHNYNDHGNLLLDPDYIICYKEIFNNRTEPDVYSVQSETFKFQLFHSKLLPETPLSFVRAENQNLIDLYFGFLTEEQLNKRINSTQYKPTKIHLLPHPLR